MTRSMFAAAVALSLGAVPATAQAPAATTVAPRDTTAWQIDVTHSELSFRIRHFVSRVRGQFNKWQGSITTDPKNLAAGSVEVTIDASSIDTNNERRDADLRSANFFEADKYPTLAFKSTKVEVNGSDIAITGDLTIKETTKPVVLKGTFNGVTNTGRQGDRMGFEVNTRINRLDWGITWNRAVEGGGVMLGDDVDITIAIEAFKPRPTAP
jgi:polyisoprenoid-binding protein YceI